MNKMQLLPKLAVTSIRKNKVVYLPYILTMALAVAVFFMFGCMISNKMLANVPYAGYMLMLLQIGRVLLAIMLVPFLFYTNSFLIKRRKKELGLYTVLGLEKKHVGIMMVVETICMYIGAVLLGLSVSVAFSKLIFMILIHVAGMPKDAVFTMDAASLFSTLALFGFVSFLNLMTNLFQVTMINPTELLREGHKGEKEPKHLWFYTFVGIITLGIGYYISITAQMDSFIFINFFLAVFMVVIGSHFLFTSGSIALLRTLKKKKNYYYKKEHFVTVSGMLYRMKRNASSLVNICIFSTMIIITLICTVTLFLSGNDILHFDSPYDGEYVFTDGSATEKDTFPKETNSAIMDKEMPVVVLTIEEYNTLENANETIEADEILFFSTARDYEYAQAVIEGDTYHIKKQLSEFCIDTKEPHTYSNRRYYVIVENEQIQTAMCGDKRMYKVLFHVNGMAEGRKAFLSKTDAYVKNMTSYYYTQNSIDRGGMLKSMNAGLLFLGVFFGLIFTIFLVLIMYYKQIAEGMEDSDSFGIMQNVGMNREDVKNTIKNQILLVFGLPLAAAILHTIVGLQLTIKLLYALNIYNTGTIQFASVMVVVIFVIFYGISYLLTAKTYYKLVIK